VLALPLIPHTLCTAIYAACPSYHPARLAHLSLAQVHYFIRSFALFEGTTVSRYLGRNSYTWVCTQSPPRLNHEDPRLTLT
jgi:hypothetical protein